MKIELIQKTKYGRPFYYPQSDFAKLLCELCGKATVTEKQLAVLDKHGVKYTITPEWVKNVPK